MSAPGAERTEQTLPVRGIHLGLGAFFKAHQAWYTHRANAYGEPAGIAAFTGRNPQAATVLNAQGCRYHVVERDASGDQFTEVSSIVSARPSSDLAAFTAAISDPAIGWVTLTITEKGYHVEPEAEAAALRVQSPQTAIGRLVLGLDHRRHQSGEPLAIIPCDNVRSNGEVLHRAVRQLAERLDLGLVEWIDSQVSFVSTMVDRITPATTGDDLRLVRETLGVDDAAAVVCEPFSEWVLSGEFPAGRPDWHSVGARFVDDVAPFEQRKLWLLNAGHSALAYVGLARGHQEISEAMRDPYCVELLDQVWADAAAVLPFPSAEVKQATDALTRRFNNPRIRHQLAQIGQDGSQKLLHRVVAVQQARRAVGLAVGASYAPIMAAWIDHLSSDQLADPHAADLQHSVAQLSGIERARKVLNFFDSEMADDDQLVATVAATAR